MGISMCFVMLLGNVICVSAATPYYYELTGDCYHQEDGHDDCSVEKKTVYVAVSDVADENEHSYCSISTNNRMRTLEMLREDGYDVDYVVNYLLTFRFKSKPIRKPTFKLTIPNSDICSAGYDASSVVLISQDFLFEDPDVTTDGSNIIVSGTLTAIYEPSYQNEFLLGFKKMDALPQAASQSIDGIEQKMVQEAVQPSGTVFDAQYYAQNNPDVVAVFGTDVEMLYQHYLNYGKQEGRRAIAR